MFTRKAIKHYLLLLAQLLLIILLLLGLNCILPSLYKPVSAVLLAGGLTIMAFTALLVFFYGINLSAEKSVLMTLVAIVIKMLLAFVNALLFLVVFKNNQTGSVILFFVLYLAFTVFVILTFLSVLKNRAV